MPPIESSKGQFEQGAPDIFYGYPRIPLPEAVGEYGVAPVFAGSVTFDTNSSTWTVSDERFDTAGAMHASNEFIWLHADEVSGFPEVGDHASAAPAMAVAEQTGKDIFVNGLPLHLALSLLVLVAAALIRGL